MKVPFSLSCRVQKKAATIPSLRMLYASGFKYFLCNSLSFITLNQGDYKRSLYSDTWPIRGINFVVLIEVQLDTHLVLSDDLISSQSKNQNGNQIHPGPTGMSHVRLMMRGMPKFGYLRKKYLL